MKCQGSTVDPQAKVIVRGFPHPGIASHTCVLEKGHDGSCECECGHRWVKNSKEI